MADEPNPGAQAVEAAEEILRLIFGDDLHGCPVGLDQVAVAIESRFGRSAGNDDLFELSEKVLEAVQLLSTPPDASKLKDPAELQVLLSERLDTIHNVTVKAIDTIERAKKERGASSPPSDDSPVE